MFDTFLSTNHPVLISSYQEARDFLKFLAVQTRDVVDGGPDLTRVADLMRLIGDPQNRIPVIHVAGTSGKGSTAYLISHLLIALGQRVGLSLSPHVLDIRERMQINEEYILEQKFVGALNKLMSALATLSGQHRLPSYYQILTAMAYQIFATEKVDYIVMETGLGGRYDASNTVTREDKVCVLTRIGFDHMDKLGNTLAKIAWEKAGIIQPGNQVFSVEQNAEAEQVFEREVKQKTARFQNQRHSIMFEMGLLDQLALIGEHQKENASLALVVMQYIAERDGFKIDEAAIKSALKTAYLIGRFDQRSLDQRQVILDGAHNPQKMHALITTLQSKFPGEAFDFLLAFNPSADQGGMLDELIPVAKRIFLPDFIMEREYRYKLADPLNIQKLLNARGYSSTRIVGEPTEAIRHLCSLPGTPVIVTGSLHFLSAVYPLFNF